MFPLILTVLNGDSSTLCYSSSTTLSPKSPHPLNPRPDGHGLVPNIVIVCFLLLIVLQRLHTKHNVFG